MLSSQQLQSAASFRRDLDSSSSAGLCELVSGQALSMAKVVRNCSAVMMFLLFSSLELVVVGAYRFKKAASLEVSSATRNQFPLVIRDHHKLL